MSRSILTVFIAFSLALCACAPGVQAQSPAVTRPSSSTATSLPATKVTIEASEPAATRTPDPTLTPVPVKPGTFETSVLVTEWNNGKREHLLYPLDPESGQALPGYPPISLGETYNHAFSPDRRILAIATSGSLRLVDLGSWKERVFKLGLGGYISGMAFEPEGRRLAIITGSRESKVAVFDLSQEAVTAQGSLDFLASHLKFSSDSQGLMVYGTVIQNRFTANEMAAGPPVVVLLDAGDLSPRWSAELEGLRDGIFPKDRDAGETVDLSQPGSAVYLYPGLAFAPDRDVLYAVHPDEDKLTTVDFAEQSVETVELQNSLTWFERLLALTAGVAHAKVAEGTSRQAVISPDGQILYVLGVENKVIKNEEGEWQIVSNPLGLQVIRTADGVRLDRFETEASEISISPDGRFLYLSSWGDNQPWTEVFDTTKMKAVARMDGMLRLAFRINGDLLLVLSDWRDETRVHMMVVDPHSLKVLAEWTGPNEIAWLSAQ